MEIINPYENNDETPPLNEDGSPKVRFEVKMRKGKHGTLEKAIFIDGELLDWAVDMSSLAEAMAMGSKYYKAVQRDIEKHFVESVSEVIGRKITAAQIKEAIKFGWI